MTTTPTTGRRRIAESGGARPGDGLEPDWTSWLADAPTSHAGVVGGPVGAELGEELGTDGEPGQKAASNDSTAHLPGPVIASPTTVRDWEQTLDELWDEPTSSTGGGLQGGVAGRRLGQPRINLAAAAASADQELASSTLDPDPMAPLAHAVRKKTERCRRHRRLVKAAVLTTVGLVVVGGVALAVFGIPATPTRTSADPTPGLAVAPAQQSPPPWCPELDEGARISGAGPGDTTSGPGQILWLEYQMYVQRNADAARQVLAPSAAAAPIEATRAAINSIPKGTEHCVYMVALAADRFAVKVEERLGARTTQTWDLVVTTAVQPTGGSLIAAILPATGEGR